MLLEYELVPYNVSSPIGERAVVLAPHPDDETIGMGGCLTLLREGGKEIKVVVLTEGEKADPNKTDLRRYASVRRREALRAFRVLGITDYEFLGFRDRELAGNIHGVERELTRIVSSFGPDTIYGPSPIELHPDHRMTAELMLSLRREISGTRFVFYEITTPLRPNVLVDITRTFRKKRKALKCYRSQLRITDYLRLIEGLNIYRTFTLEHKVEYAEAFWEVNDAEFTISARNWLSYEMPGLWK